MANALKYSMISGCAFICFLVHAFIPAMFEFNGSEMIILLGRELDQKRQILAAKNLAPDQPKIKED